MCIFKINFVLPDLSRWVKYFPEVTSNPRCKFVASSTVLAFIPLLEFDNNSILSTAIIPASDQAVEPARCERELELKNDAVFQKRTFLEYLRHTEKRVTPRINLARTGMKSEF